jgi:hypothetical protein
MVDTTSATDSNAAVSDLISEAGAPEIEITPEMIAAGADKFLLFDAADAEIAAFSVFRAMLGASQKFRNAVVTESEIDASDQEEECTPR